MTLRKLNSPFERQVARRGREMDWAFMERLARAPVHVCLWNKYHKKERGNETMLCLMGGVYFMTWVREHRSWFGHGAYNPDRTTFLFWLTPAGRAAVRRRDPKHNNAVVNGGLVEPGYQVMPVRDFHRALNEQRNRIRQRHGLSPCAFIRPLTEKSEPEIRPKRRRRRAGKDG